MTLTQNLIKLFAHVSRRRRWQLFGLLFLIFLGVFAEMATLGTVVPFLALLADPSIVNRYPILEGIFNSFDYLPNNILLSAVILFAVVAIFGGFVRILLMWVSLRISFGLGADIGGQVYLKTLYQPYRWHISKNSSEILSAIDKVNVIIIGVINPVIQGFVSLLISLGIFLMLFIINPITAIVVGIGFCLFYYFFSITLNHRIQSNGKIVSKNMTYRVQAIQEGLGGIRDILIDGTQYAHYDRFKIFDIAMRRGQSFNALISASPRYIIESVGMVLIAILAYWLVWGQDNLGGAITVLGALAVGAQKLLPQMQLIYHSWSSINSNRNQLNEVVELLQYSIPYECSLPNLVRDISNDDKYIKQPNLDAPQIYLKNVNFRYKPESPEVLRNINLKIFQGDCVGFIGKTGSGKSTLIDLIMGLLDPSDGQIEIHGHVLTAKNIRTWQKCIAHVPQSIYLSDSTISENIALSSPFQEINIENVKAASKKAQLHDFILTLPEQYETLVGEQGVRLSGGQRQRIGIARALYKKSNVIIFDEATSALDNVTEKAVMKAVDNTSENQTCLIITHRVESLANCDYIVRLDRGAIDFIGTYQEIMRLAEIDN